MDTAYCSLTATAALNATYVTVYLINQSEILYIILPLDGTITFALCFDHRCVVVSQHSMWSDLVLQVKFSKSPSTVPFLYFGPLLIGQ